MRKNRATGVAVITAALMTAGGGVAAMAWAQTQSQPGTPSKNPKQNDPGKTNPSQPGQTNPSQPGKTNPSEPGRTNPNNPGQSQPVNPSQGEPERGNQPDVDNSQERIDRDNRDRQVRDLNLNRYPRPFAFESAASEARFADSSRRLLLLERRMDDNNKDLMKRLGDVRQMRGEAQTAGMLDLMQQILKEHQELHDYLVQARTGWTGEMELNQEGVRRDPEYRGEPARPSTDATPREQNPR